MDNPTTNETDEARRYLRRVVLLILQPFPMLRSAFAGTLFLAIDQMPPARARLAVKELKECQD